MRPPKITIVTPSLNQGKYIEETIKSVLQQNYPNLEYIIMDGGSTDESLKIIENYSGELYHWESNSDRGQAHAINKGFKMATGDIVSWLNSDDKLYKGALCSVAKYFNDYPTKHLVHGSGLFFNDNGRYWYPNKNYKDIEARYITHFAFDLQPSVFFRRQVFDGIGFLDESFNLQFDSEFFVRLALNYGILKIDEKLSYFRQHNLRKSRIEYPKLQYPHEFVRLYSRVLRSLRATARYRDMERYTSIAKLLGLFISDNVKYPVKNTFSRKQLERSFFIFLKRCCGFFYHILDYERTLQILKVLQIEFPDHYMRDRDLQRIERRLSLTRVLKMMPKWTVLKFRELSSMYSNRKYLIR